MRWSGRRPRGGVRGDPREAAGRARLATVVAVTVWTGSGVPIGQDEHARGEPDLRKGTAALVVAATTEFLVVGRSVGNIAHPHHPSHHPQTAKHAPRVPARATGTAIRSHKQRQRRLTQPRTCLRESAREGHRPVMPRVARCRRATLGPARSRRPTPGAPRPVTTWHPALLPRETPSRSKYAPRHRH